MCTAGSSTFFCLGDPIFIFSLTLQLGSNSEGSVPIQHVGGSGIGVSALQPQAGVVPTPPLAPCTAGDMQGGQKVPGPFPSSLGRKLCCQRANEISVWSLCEATS